MIYYLRNVVYAKGNIYFLSSNQTFYSVVCFTMAVKYLKRISVDDKFFNPVSLLINCGFLNLIMMLKSVKSAYEDYNYINNLIPLN